MSLQNDIESLVKSVGLKLYDTAILNENDETIFRVSVISDEFEDSKRKSLSLDEYVELTHLISPLLDVTPPISGNYRLEVGSPGIERKLVTLDNFTNSVGERVMLTLNDKTKIKALLSDVKEEILYLENEDGKLEIEFRDIKKAKTYFEW